MISKDDKIRLNDLFNKTFQKDADIYIKYPYRLNLSAAYVDGLHEPQPSIVTTIDKYVYIAAAKVNMPGLIIYSKEYNELRQVWYNQPGKGTGWVSYIRGVISVLSDHYCLKYGAYITIDNDLPSGLGLGSSAAFLMGIIETILQINDFQYTTAQLVYYAYEVEHDFLGILCGRMDFKAVSKGPGVYFIDNQIDSDIQDKKIKSDTLPSRIGIIYVSNHVHSLHYSEDRTMFTDILLGIRFTDKCHHFQITVPEELREWSIFLMLNNMWTKFAQHFVDDQDMWKQLINTTRIPSIKVPTYFNFSSECFKTMGSGLKGAVVFFLFDSQEQIDIPLDCSMVMTNILK